VQALSEAEYKTLLEQHGFTDVETVRVPDAVRLPETYSGKWFNNAEELRDFKRIGALLLIATPNEVKPVQAAASKAETAE